MYLIQAPSPKVLKTSLNASFTHYPYLGASLGFLLVLQSDWLHALKEPRLLTYCKLLPPTPLQCWTLIRPIFTPLSFAMNYQSSLYLLFLLLSITLRTTVLEWNKQESGRVREMEGEQRPE